MLYPQIAQTLVTMAQTDHLYRKQFLKDRKEGKLPQWDSSMDKSHTRQIKAIIEQIGWPSVSAVGEKASFEAWLLVQHADHDLAFQKSCLALMMELPSNEIDPANIAYLMDRILVSEGKLQRYGTQSFYDQNQKLVSHPVEEEQTLNQRRLGVGLEPVEL